MLIESNLWILAGLIAALLVVIIIIVALIITLSKKKKGKKSLIDITEYVTSVGGKENIISVSFNQSRLQLTLKDTSLVDIEKLKTLGASGVVKNNNKVNVIIGKISEQLAKEINKIIG
jgi:glucose-like phosphotransferase system IIB component